MPFRLFPPLPVRVTPYNSFYTTPANRMARHLLEEGRTVREAAEQSGFSSLRTFYRVYRQIAGSTPSGGQRNPGGAQ